MIRKKVCPKCGSTNCEESEEKVIKEQSNLYPLGTNLILCYLCYNCGASKTSYLIQREFNFDNSR